MTERFRALGIVRETYGRAARFSPSHRDAISDTVAASMNLPPASPDEEGHSATQERSRQLAHAQQAALEFRRALTTVILGTVSASGDPEASVAPAVLGPDGSFLVYVSSLAAHTRNLLHSRKASVLLVEDEAKSSQPMARRRMTFACSVHPLVRDTGEFAASMPAFRQRFGAIVTQLECLPDFQLFRLTPQRGRLVLGFGQAYEVDPSDWSRLSRVGPGGAAPPRV